VKDEANGREPDDLSNHGLACSNAHATDRSP